MIRLDDLSVFVRTADTGSLSAAARALGLSPAVTSAAVLRLEKTLGQRLFLRSTRRLRLTDAGERYLVHAREATRALEEGAMALGDASRPLAGTLRLSVPSDIGRNQMLGWLDDFLALHPQVVLQLWISDRLADFYREPVDLAVRYGKPEDSSLVALPLAPDNRRVLCASPAYLACHGAPASVEALAQHNCLCFRLGDAVNNRWRFFQGAKRTPLTVTVQGNRNSDDADAVRRWAVAGHGIAYKSRLDVADDLAAGRLRVLFPDGLGDIAPLNLICMHRSHVTPLVAQLRAHLVARCLALA